MTDGTVNDEFGSLGEVAAELGLKQAAIKPVARHSVEVGGHQQVSGLVWGETEPELVFLHGGGQVAHTWDLVLTALPARDRYRSARPRALGLARGPRLRTCH